MFSTNCVSIISVGKPLKHYIKCYALKDIFNFNCPLYPTYCVSLIRCDQACRKEKKWLARKKEVVKTEKKLLFKVQTYKFQDVDEEFEEN